ncbi:hypothetical protein DH2020_020951 [Rehmannia glutinosa]|uniref:FHA domain-containing protein n=1 Tax=Rehmannia glutinosa TaxID=99300 RepID=A0ABR0WBH9_REHGL
MEMTSNYLSYARANSLSPPLFPNKSTVIARSSVNFGGYNCLPRKLNFSASQLRKFGAIRASDSESTTSTNGSLLDYDYVRYIAFNFRKLKCGYLTGDGDTRHIGYKIAMPGAFEIASNVVTVGRVREKADIVISVPTVSGLHARIQKTEENLLITDLDSTNGTFIDEKRLQPGVVSAASPGNLITFGDTNLAIFRVYKLEKEEFTSEPEESGNEASSKVESTS